MTIWEKLVKTFSTIGKVLLPIDWKWMFKTIKEIWK